MKKLFEKIKNKIIDLFRKITGRAKIVIPIGIDIVNAIKRITDSDIADIFVELTSSGLDNKVLNIIRNLLPTILKELQEWEYISGLSEAEMLKESLVKINSYNKAKRDILYLGIASHINEQISNGELDYAKAVTLTHEIYNDPNLINL
jgi:hypothetical protein